MYPLNPMNPMKTLGLVLMVAGVVVLSYVGYGYLRDSNEARIGTTVLSVRNERAVDVPIWVGLGGVVVGGALFFAGNRSRMI